jgi:hypothetical protein
MDLQHNHLALRARHRPPFIYLHLSLPVLAAQALAQASDTATMTHPAFVAQSTFICGTPNLHS